MALIDGADKSDDPKVWFETAGFSLITPNGRSRPAWEKRYVLKLLVTDASIIIFSVILAQVLRYGAKLDAPTIPLGQSKDLLYNYTILSVAIIVTWMIALQFFESRDIKVFGSGPSEYKRVVTATLSTFGLLGVLAFIFKSPIGRGYLLIALPLGFILLLVSRWLWRKRLHRQRKRGVNSYTTLLVGERKKSKLVARQITSAQYSGFKVIGSITESATNKDLVPGVPVLGNYSQILAEIDKNHVEILIITGSDIISPDELRQLGWELESRGVHLIVAASLTDIAGPRIHARPVSGLPLIQIDYPEFRGRKYTTKRLFDIVVSLFALIILSPLLIVLALIVKTGSPGPVIFKQPRVGLEGNKFLMYKFRSMVVDAEDQLPGLLDQSDGNDVLFKLKNDPRITKNGRWMRKYSLDELPQLLNVLKGEMSLVGPRPPLPKEVKTYEDWVYRRLLVKPGITGLWQVSGRSDLSWEDSVRLDLYYVENWSMTEDVLILLRTVKVILQPEGAY